MQKGKKISVVIALLMIICTLNAGAQVQKFVEGKPFIHYERLSPNPNFPPNPLRAPYRTLDGTNNNLDSQRKNWGATDIPLLRDMPAEYSASNPNSALGGSTRPSARKVSNVVCNEPVTTFNSRNLSAFVYIWGQFLDHDMSLTPTGSTESEPILLPADEPLFTVDIPFSRSEVYPGTGVNTPRQQKNLNTSWIDASMVYGTETNRANWLRTLHNGKLKTSTGDLMPYNTITGEYNAAIDPNAPSMVNDANHTVKTFVAGDVRAAEHPGLSSLQTLFVREHNKICDRLVSQGSTNDEQNYQKARKEVGALIQVITYQEFLPAMGIVLSDYLGYKLNIQPDITNNFATAAYRIGHTMVADDIVMRNNDCEEVGPGEFDLLDVFWQPHLLIDYNVEPFLKGFAVHTQYETDTKINSVLRNMLFGDPASPIKFGLDLGAINIQRGRDHGLANYNTTRKFYTGHSATTFAQITSDTALASKLKSLYGNVNNIDLWVGLLAENRLNGKSVGNTMHVILKSQFEKLRDGDFYFYKNDPFLPPQIRNQVSSTTFADVIKRNTTLTNLQANVFFTEACPSIKPASAGDRSGAADAVSTEAMRVNLYPNPVQDQLTIQFFNLKSNGSLAILGIDGRIIQSVSIAAEQNHIQINTASLANGIYFVQATSGNEQQVTKFVKIGQ
jgi:hypothetical protein